MGNPYNLHAEYNISTLFPIIKLIDKNYIGVSKLCCGYCHAYLSEAGYKHRGTHGLCDKWTPLPIQGEHVKESVDKGAWQKQENPNQQKRLSWDKFEAEILVLGISLYDYKSKKSLFLLGDMSNHDLLDYHEHPWC